MTFITGIRLLGAQMGINFNSLVIQRNLEGELPRIKVGWRSFDNKIFSNERDYQRI